MERPYLYSDENKSSAFYKKKYSKSVDCFFLGGGQSKTKLAMIP